jgi:hypothetical protein
VTLAIKDGNTQLQAISTQTDVAGSLVPVDVPASVVGNIATPASSSAPLPVINAAGAAAVDGSGTIASGGAAQSLAKTGADPEEEIQKHLGVEVDPEALWQLVKTNLKAGRIRMLFVADRIPAELRLIVKFLNQQMDPAEMLALELRQYVGEGLKTIVPMVYGQTEKKIGGNFEVNFEGTLDFEGIKKKCTEEQNTIDVGFMGGVPRLLLTPLALLRDRTYKWDWHNGRGKKTRQNWIPGARFLELLGEVEKRESSGGPPAA